MEMIENSGNVPQFPDVEAGYLVRYLFECGPYINNGMGVSGVSWQEINAWQQQTGIALAAWESKAIKLASSAYAFQASISTKKDCISPMPKTDIDVVKQSKNFKSILRNSAK